MKYRLGTTAPDWTTDAYQMVIYRLDAHKRALGPNLLKNRAKEVQHEMQRTVRPHRGALTAIRPPPPTSATPAKPSRAAQQEAPTRASRYAFLDNCLAALKAREPTRVPWAQGALYTENNVALKPGDGLWGTLTALGDYDFRFADPFYSTHL